MRRYGEPPSDQMALPGLGTEGLELMREARKWAGRHYREFMWYKHLAKRECERAKDGKASPNWCLQSMRREFRIEIPNAYAPCLARIAMEQDKGIRFRVARSKVDGYTNARLS